jgi:hypothetical protein
MTTLQPQNRFLVLSMTWHWPDKSVVYELTTSKSMSDSTCGIFIFWSDPNKFDISLTVSFPGIKYLISEGIETFSKTTKWNRTGKKNC